jgi:hypothetical protein
MVVAFIGPIVRPVFISFRLLFFVCVKVRSFLLLLKGVIYGLAFGDTIQTGVAISYHRHPDRGQRDISGYPRIDGRVWKRVRNIKEYEARLC